MASPIRVGVAGWDYPDWSGVLYPSPRPRGFDPLRFLADFVPLVEINSTFYGPPRETTARAWVARVRDVPGFRYTAKLWRRFTHQRDTAWTAQEVGQVRAGTDVLAEAGLLDALLLQFPWSFRNGEPEREWLSDVLREFTVYPCVVEVRHASWNEPAFYDWLRQTGAGFVNIDQPRFRRSIAPSAHATGAVGYIRVHGRNYHDWFRRDAGRDARYDCLYPPEELEAWVTRAEDVAGEPDTAAVDVVFNNHYRAQAVVNALQFRAMLEGEPPAAPARLVEHYASALQDCTSVVQTDERGGSPAGQ